jgi:hypothetical protein
MEISTFRPAFGAQRGSTAMSSWVVQLRWFALGAVAAFAVPFLFSSLLELQHDIYLAVYFTFVIGLVAAYVHRNEIDLGALARRNWMWGLAAGVVVGVPVVRNVFTESETARPDGVYLAFELLWRGVTYGAIDAVLLTVFPCLIVYKAIGGPLRTWRKRAAYFAASLALVMTITASYHLGYDHYRDEGVRAPETGNVLMSAPMLLTANPIGSVVDHSAMHVAAVIHEYEGDTRLPPQTDAP